MIDVDVDVSEFTRYAFDLARAAGTVGSEAAAVVRKSAAANERDQKAYVSASSVETGALLDSISTSFEGDGRFATFTAEIGPTVDYGIFLEVGTSEMPAEPFVRPAFDKNLPPFIGALELLVEGSLR